MQGQVMTFVVIPKEEFEEIKAGQKRILEKISCINISTTTPSTLGIGYLTAIEFMNAVKIKRSKFDELIASNQIKTIKKKRKIYVPETEVVRYFQDPNIQ